MQITSGRVKKPFNVILYGVPGIGKSTWAEAAPKPLFVGGEENDELNAMRMPTPTSFDDFLNQLRHIIKTKPDYQTLVVDTADSIEKLMHKVILSTDKNSKGSMAAAHGGYGKAYEIAERMTIEVRDLLKQLRDVQGKNIIILAHSTKISATDTVIGLQYDTYEMSLHKKSMPILVDWVSCVLFANYIAYKNEDENSDKVFALGNGERMVFTEKRPGFLAKNRFKLPFKMPLDFEAFYSAYNKFYEGAPVSTHNDASHVPEVGQDELTLTNQAVALSDQIKDEELKQKIKQLIVEANGDADTLNKYIKRINDILTKG